MGLEWDGNGIGMGLGWDWDGIPLPVPFPLFFLYTPNHKNHNNLLKIIKSIGSTISFWERLIFAAEKALAATKSHLNWGRRWIRTSPLGLEAGGPTTWPDLGELEGN